MGKPLISLCVPTNGVPQWVFPVLDSIYGQGVEETLFEVVITDNGNNEEFQTRMSAYAQAHSNLVYEKTNALPFLNEIEAYKRASGEFIKFLNHRTMLTDGALHALLEFVRENAETKPIVYFANGVLNKPRDVFSYDTFDKYVANLSYWSSWSTGMGFWKRDFESIPEDTVFNELFPHTTVLFRERNRSRYLIDNRVLLEELPTGTVPKGRYDLFYAFAVEYPGIICDLLRDGSITAETFLYVKKENLKFITQLYLDYVLRRRPCSYDLSSYRSSIRVFYSHAAVSSRLCGQVLRKLKNRLHFDG